jgi:hypothetical protein
MIDFHSEKFRRAESMIMKEYLPIVPFFFESSEFSRNLRFSHLY